MSRYGGRPLLSKIILMRQLEFEGGRWRLPKVKASRGDDPDWCTPSESFQKSLTQPLQTITVNERGSVSALEEEELATRLVQSFKDLEEIPF